MLQDQPKEIEMLRQVSPLQIDQCDTEPVNFIGSIQPFGALLAFDEKNGKLSFASTNWRDIFRSFPKNPTLKNFNLMNYETLAGPGWIGRHFSSEGYRIIEAERGEGVKDHRLENPALTALQNTGSLSELLSLTTQSVAKITDMDRVMIYRFHPDLHGEVVAETIRGETESFLGLHYPASDIPAPARSLFLKSWIRMIPGVNYDPVPIQNVMGSEKPLDLGGSLLRAVSPIHLEYLRNMGVGASLTISLQQEGKLWGLVACHSNRPHFIDRESRAACESIGRFTSALITIKNEQDKNAARTRFRSVHNQLVERMRSAEDIGLELTQHRPNLLDLIRADGSAAALHLNGFSVSIGKVPTEDQLERLVDWLEENHRLEPVFLTDRLPSLYPEGETFKKTACGLLALQILKTLRNYILWFRPEITETVSWAGKPDKAEAPTGRLHPRASFNLWTQEVSGRSKPWSELEKEIALELRNSIIAADLKFQFQKEQAARAEAERAVDAREELMSVLSHDLKNPVGSIKISAALAKRQLPKNSDKKLADTLDRINRAASNMNALIEDILSLTKLESGYQSFLFKNEDVRLILQEVIDILKPIATEKRIRIEALLTEEPCFAEVDRGAIHQIFSNILGNAVKFTPNNGKITLTLERFSPESIKATIADNGPGIAPSSLEQIFDRFWQAKQMRKLGTGLGLAIAKRLVQAHNGSIEAKSDGKAGTTFHVLIPVAGAQQQDIRLLRIG
jgi:two-component system, chemotaxis family, sensor kinase Cph1